MAGIYAAVALEDCPLSVSKCSSKPDNRLILIGNLTPTLDFYALIL